MQPSSHSTSISLKNINVREVPVMRRVAPLVFPGCEGQPADVWRCAEAVRGGMPTFGEMAGALTGRLWRRVGVEADREIK